MMFVKLAPLGDSGVTVYCADEEDAWQLARVVRHINPPWLLDVVQAYTTVAVFFALDQTRMQQVIAFLEQADASRQDVDSARRLHCIPCCYDLGLDLERVAEHTGLPAAQIVERHSAATYTVYAIGFCPGFPYLGYLDDRLSGVPRLPSPRLRVEAGSVGLTGRQTGIYTEERPGGWNIIARTPLQLVHVADGYFPLRTGDQVQFEPIDRGAFERLQGKRLHNEPEVRIT